MAKQAGDIIIIGTIDDITFYVMEGKGYARKKSRLTGKRVKKDPKFKRTMQSAHRLGRGSQLASKVYRSLPKTEQVYTLYKELKRIAVLALKEGKGETDVMLMLERKVKPSKPTRSRVLVNTNGQPIAISSPLFTKRLFRVRSAGKCRRRKRPMCTGEVFRE